MNGKRSIWTNLKRKKSLFVGVLDCSSGNCFLIPDNKKTPFDIFIPPQKKTSDFLKKKLLVEVQKWDINYKNPIGHTYIAMCYDGEICQKKNKCLKNIKGVNIGKYMYSTNEWSKKNKCNSYDIYHSGV